MIPPVTVPNSSATTANPFLFLSYDRKIQRSQGCRFLLILFFKKKNRFSGVFQRLHARQILKLLFCMSGFCVGCDLGALQVGIHRSHKGHRKRSKPLSLQTVQNQVVKEPFTWKSKSLQSVKRSIFSVLGRMPLPVSRIPPVPSALGLLDSIAGKIKSHLKSSIQCLTPRKHFG